MTDNDPIAVPSGPAGHESVEAPSSTLSPAVFGTPAAVEPIIRLQEVSIWYGLFRAVRGFSTDIRPHQVTALIGPSGSGKSTLLRSINRMNDLIPGARLEGEILYHGQDLYGPGIDAVEVRRRIGMVFQKPNPFPKTIYDNVAFGPRLSGFKG
ncbi:MAG TPA: ATP-binding cassette domain-containing protein, partial [Candidatus Saccharimonadia bacterium]|nr:ATP-binding cassette domain-containing protein [Candidatus Saccharimonadia bacterium]